MKTVHVVLALEVLAIALLIHKGREEATPPVKLRALVMDKAPVQGAAPKRSGEKSPAPGLIGAVNYNDRIG